MALELFGEDVINEKALDDLSEEELNQLMIILSNAGY
jgi:hypothetical protein